jgi:copper chaperone CopZ
MLPTALPAAGAAFQPLHASCDGRSPDKHAAAAAAGGGGGAEWVEVTLAVHGMTCGACVAAVAGALRQAPGVSAAEVALHPRGLAWVTVAAGDAEGGGRAAAIGALVNAVSACGFSAQPEGVKGASGGARRL